MHLFQPRLLWSSVLPRITLPDTACLCPVVYFESMNPCFFAHCRKPWSKPTHYFDYTVAHEPANSLIYHPVRLKLMSFGWEWICFCLYAYCTWTCVLIINQTSQSAWGKAALLINSWNVQANSQNNGSRVIWAQVRVNYSDNFVNQPSKPI